MRTMVNITIFDSFPTEDVNHVTSTTINPYLQNTTATSSQDIYNSTPPNWTADETAEVSTVGLWLYLVVRLLWGGLAIFGNGLIIFVVIKFERLQTCTNYLICSLAVSDLLAGLIVPLLIVHEIYPKSEYFISICLFQKILSIISSAGNLLNILYLSIDRYIYIAFPLRYHGLVTPRKTCILLSITCGLCLLCVPTLVITGNHLQLGMPCKYHIFLDDWVKNIYMAPQFCLIVFLTIGFHLAIAKIAYHQAKQIHAEQQPYTTLAVAINQSTKKISRTIGMVLGVYLFSIMPQVIVSSNKYMSSWDRYTMILYWTNTWVNPLIYAWRLKDFKIAFKKTFTGIGSFNEIPGMVA